MNWAELWGGGPSTSALWTMPWCLRLRAESYGGPWRRVNRPLADPDLEKHFDKILIGRIGRALDLLGDRFSPGTLELAAQMVGHFAKRFQLPYE